jgi:hypothetical protein
MRQYNVEGCSAGIIDGSDKYTVEMASEGMIYVPSFMKIALGIQVILRLIPRQSERLQCWYSKWEGFMMHAVEMTSDSMTHTYQVS